ncbi:ATP7 [Candida pseudojiufengensis]|uniref:ATP7 n=1 Tax=Candida pseudojiufengensis TaxID=497109 RepID=UPI0022242D07|nr:ATP7 [Candida pseudojiufengensis]KAI5963250.1 ATP7 [Candida pseudojiufengensis]
MSVAQSATKKINFAGLIKSLGLTGETAASLNAFKKRYDEAKKTNIDLLAQPTEVDFNHYRSVLKNSKIVDEVEKAVQSFKPVSIDLSKNLKNIDIFEQKAIENAQLTEKSVGKEIEALKATLKDIESSRPFDQLTVDDVAAARPDLDDKVTYMVKRGKWNLKSYQETFGDLSVM